MASRSIADPRNAAELGRHNTLSGYLKSHFGRAHGGRAGDYVALLAYIERDEAHTRGAAARCARASATKPAPPPALGFGPRFLHSTGQAYKGGPNSGVFLQITCDDPADLACPASTTASAWSRRRRPAAISTCWPNAAAARCASISSDVDAGLAELGRARSMRRSN